MLTARCQLQNPTSNDNLGNKKNIYELIIVLYFQ